MQTFTERKKEKRRDIQRMALDFRREMEEMGLYEHKPKRRDIKKATNTFAFKQNQEREIFKYVFPQMLQARNFDDFYLKYRSYKASKGESIQKIEEDLSLFEQVRGVMNDFKVSVFVMTDCFIYQKGEAYVPSRELTYENLMWRIKRLHELANNDQDWNEMKKIEKRVNEFSKIKWESPWRKEQKVILALLDEQLEKILYENSVLERFSNKVFEDVKKIYEEHKRKIQFTVS